MAPQQNENTQEYKYFVLLSKNTYPGCQVTGMPKFYMQVSDIGRSLVQNLLHQSSWHLEFLRWLLQFCGPGSVVSIATGYRLEGPGIESRWEARFSAPVQTGPGANPAIYTMGAGSFLGVKSSPEHDTDPSPASSAVVKKE